MKNLAALLVLLATALARADVSVPGAIGGRPFTCRPEKSLPLYRGPNNRRSLVDRFKRRLVVKLDDAAHVLELEAPDGWIAWRAPVPGVWADSIDALIDGQQVVVAFYGFISSGSALMSFDLATGRRLWTADVAQLNVAHSEYWNVVTIEQRGEEIVLRGDEAGGCYLQTFDARTGRRRLNLAHRKW